MAWKKTFLGLVISVLAACSGENTVTDTGGGTDTATTDSTTADTTTADTSTDTSTGADTSTGTDAATDAPNVGSCGATVHSCICTCGNNMSCQQTCLQADMPCLQCVVGAQAQCCPAEANAFLTCGQAAQMASDAGPACAATDQACIMARCGTEITAFQTCVQAASATATCQGYLAVCLGPQPIMCP